MDDRPGVTRSRQTARAVIARVNPAKGMTFDASMCKYRAVPAVAAALGYTVLTAEDERDPNAPPGWNLFWTDLSVSHQRVAALLPLQKVNHFADMTTLCNKATCASVLKRVSRSFPLEYNFYPRSWKLPKEAAALRKLMLSPEAPRVLIVKPNRGCQGVDISICCTNDELDTARQEMGQQCVAQEYVDKPLLLDGYKFDLRIYVCVTCCSPLRVHLYREGIARLCTEKYEAPSAGGPAMMAPPAAAASQSPRSSAHRPMSAISAAKAAGRVAAKTTGKADAKGSASSSGSGASSSRNESGSGVFTARVHRNECGSSAIAQAGMEGVSPSGSAAAGAPAAAASDGASSSGAGVFTARVHSSSGAGVRAPKTASKVTAAAAATDWRYRHLTNYAINKTHPDFVVGGEDGSSKRLLTELLDTLRRDGFDVDMLWGEVQQLVVKTLIAVQPHIAHSYTSCRPATDTHPFSCFELLGLDLLIDESGRPWLLEVNHSPSLATDTPLDRELKSRLLSDTIRLCSFSAAEARLVARAAERRDAAPAAIPKLRPIAEPRSAEPGSSVRSRRLSADGGISTLRARLEVARERSRSATSATSGFSSVAASFGFGARGLETRLGMPGVKQQLVQQGLAERRQQAELTQAELLRLREEYEAANSSSFELIFPAPHEKLQSLYEMLLNASLRAYIEESPVNFNGGARVPIPPLLPPDAGADWWSMIKLGRVGERILQMGSDAPSAIARSAQRDAVASRTARPGGEREQSRPTGAPTADEEDGVDGDDASAGR